MTKISRCLTMAVATYLSAGIAQMLAGGSFFTQAKADNDYNSLVINEIQVANIDTYIDNSNNYGAWIELYNTTSSVINISYYYISDDANNLTKFRFPSTIGTVPAKGFKTIWFDHNSADGTYGSNANKQVRFNLDADGGTIYFSDTSGKLLFSQEYPAAISRCSYARTADNGSTWRWTSTPTPDATNAGSTFADEQLEAPVPNRNSGYFNNGDKLTISAPEGATIRYTTDGSTPTLTNGTTISSNATVYLSKTQVYRFRAFKSGYLPSPVVTRTFILNDGKYMLPIVSVVTNNKNLYDNTIGIYCDGTNGITGRGVNYKSNKNMDWERPVNFEYITPDGGCVLNQEVSFYISGGWSRHWAPTSFKLKAQKVFEGASTLDYPFFSEKPYIKNKVVVMRNGGNDNWCRAKDAMIQHIIHSSGMYIDGQSYNPCHVFLNGVYLAMLNMREPNNKFYAYANYGIDTDAIDAFEMGDGKYKQMAGTNTSFNTWLQLASNATNADTYNQIITEYVDIDEYINYMAAQCYIGGSDWLTNNNNTKGFKAWDNGRFHHVLFDVDAGFDYNDMLSKLKGSNMNNPIILFNRMAKNADFKRQFVATYCILNGSIFTDKRVKEAYDFIGAASEAALALENKNPWGTLNDVTSRITNTSNRNTRMNALKNYFGLSTAYNVQLNTNVKEAMLTINNVPVPENNFNGPLFAPFTLNATAPAGYNFVGWKVGNQTNTTIMASASSWKYYDKGSLDGTDWISENANTSNWKTGKAPLGYGKDGLNTTISYGGNSNNKYITYYFRNTVNFAEAPTSADQIQLNMVVDDGCIVYINGVEAARHLMPAGTPDFNTVATTWCEGNPDRLTVTLDATLFKKGANTIAVEVHNNSNTSSDIYWDASLTMSTVNGTISTTDREITVNSLTAAKAYSAVFEPVPEEYLVAAGQTPVVINEVSAANNIFINDQYKKNDWIELYNTTDHDIDIAGMYLSDKADNPTKYQITAEGLGISTIIPAHGHMVIWADKLDPVSQLHTGFKLGNEDGECVVLTAADHSWQDLLTYPTHQGTETVGRYPDGGKQVFLMSQPTIGKRNFLTTYAQWQYGEDTNFSVEEYIAGVDTPTGSHSIKEEYYTIDGIRLDAPQRGLNIIRRTDANGNVTTKKIIIR